MADLNDTSLGLWSQMPRSLVLTPEYFSWVAEELNFDLVAIMIDGADRDPKFHWREKDVEKALRLADPYAIEIVLTTWPYPDRNQIDAQCSQIRKLLAVGPVAAWETDEEFNWLAKMVQGFQSVLLVSPVTYAYGIEIVPSAKVRIGKAKSAFDIAGDYFVWHKGKVCQEFQVRNEMTTFTYHTENGPKADTVEGVDRVLIQTYGVDERDGKPISFDHSLGPGNIQHTTLDRTMQIPAVAEGVTEIGVGHAAWSQDNFWRAGKRVDPEEAMRINFEASLAYPVTDHRWWVDKFAYPKSRFYNGYSERYLKSLRASQ